MVLQMKTLDGRITLSHIRQRRLLWLVMLLCQQLSYLTLDHSLLTSDMAFGTKNGFQTWVKERFHSQKVLIHWKFLPMIQIKLYGRHKDYQLIEFLLKMLLLLFLVTDTHFLLIHNFKDKNGLKVKKEEVWWLFNFLKRNGKLKLKWPYQMVVP